MTAFTDPFWRAATASTDSTIGAIAAKAEKETAYHLRHAAEWLIRLGDGTAESHRRAQTALDDLWPYTGELFSRRVPTIDAASCRTPRRYATIWNATIDSASWLARR